MYNEEQKTKFIRDYTDSISTANNAKSIFDKIEDDERAAGMDFSCFSNEQAQIAIDKLGTRRHSSNEPRLGVLRKYVGWCLEQGFDGVNRHIIFIDASNAKNIQSYMLRDPLDLLKCLDAVFDPVEKNTLDNVFRLYVWLLYSGMTSEQALRCTKNDVSYKYSVIRLDGKEFPIYREFVDNLISCVDSKVFSERNPNVSLSKDFRKRCDGDELIRGFRRYENPRSLEVACFSRLKSGFKEGVCRPNLNIGGVRLSGDFYRMFERERLGFPVDFTAKATEDMEGKTYKLNKVKTINVVRGRIALDYKQDYELWKEAFNLA